MFFLYTVELSSDESLTEIELIKKISSNYIKKAINSSKSLDEVVSKVGITSDELKRVCYTLKIDLDIYEDKVPDQISLQSIEKINSKEYIPDVIIEYNGLSPYIILVEKSSHKIYLLNYKNGKRTLEGVFECKTGKNRGDKIEEGDHKTPEGIFFLVGKYNRDQIRSMVGNTRAYEYGEMAFVIDFPNYFDKINKKNGGGIWLHGTDEPFSETPEYDTRGCVVTTNETIKTLSKYIELRKTPLIIVENLNFYTKNDNEVLKKEFLDMIESWRSSWEEKKIDDYISHYSEDFKDRGRNRSQYKNYKGNEIFKFVKIYHIKLDNIILLKHNDSMIAQFVQDYSASNMSTKNVKRLYFVKDNNSWDIISEKIQN